MDVDAYNVVEAQMKIKAEETAKEGGPSSCSTCTSSDFPVFVASDDERERERVDVCMRL